jgi:hypothetical protein
MSKAVLIVFGIACLLGLLVPAITVLAGGANP